MISSWICPQTHTGIFDRKKYLKISLKLIPPPIRKPGYALGPLRIFLDDAQFIEIKFRICWCNHFNKPPLIVVCFPKIHEPLDKHFTKFKNVSESYFQRSMKLPSTAHSRPLFCHSRELRPDRPGKGPVVDQALHLINNLIDLISITVLNEN